MNQRSSASRSLSVVLGLFAVVTVGLHTSCGGEVDGVRAPAGVSGGTRPTSQDATIAGNSNTIGSATSTLPTTSGGSPDGGLVGAAGDAAVAPGAFALAISARSAGEWRDSNHRARPRE
jgi:hypothetical protein